MKARPNSVSRMGAIIRVFEITPDKLLPLKVWQHYRCLETDCEGREDYNCDGCPGNPD